MHNVTSTRGTMQTLLSTEMNSLANNSNAVHASSVAVTSAGFSRAEVELLVQFGTNPTANSAIRVWFLREIDGTNFEDGGASVTPTRVPDAIFSLRAVTTAQRVVVQSENLHPIETKHAIPLCGMVSSVHGVRACKVQVVRHCTI